MHTHTVIHNMQQKMHLLKTMHGEGAVDVYGYDEEHDACGEYDASDCTEDTEDTYSRCDVVEYGKDDCDANDTCDEGEGVNAPAYT